MNEQVEKVEKNEINQNKFRSSTSLLFDDVTKNVGANKFNNLDSGSDFGSIENFKNKKTNLNEKKSDYNENENENESQNRINLLEIQLKAMENIFSLQEKVLSENGLRAALEGERHQRMSDIEKEKEKERVRNEGRNEGNEERERRMNKGREESKERVEREVREVGKEGREREEWGKRSSAHDTIIFKNVNVQNFPYLRLLELWRKRCVLSAVERLQGEKVNRLISKGF